MQDHYNQILFENSIEAKVNTEIMAIEVKGNHFVLKTEGKNFEADLVINCSFTGMNLGSKTLHQPTMDLVYQKTVCFKCKTYEPIFGITILDGKFPTVFPSFWDENSTQLDCFVLYHVTHSVCRQQNSVQYPKFSPIGSKELKDRYELTLNDVEKFIPKFGNKIGEVKFLIGDRIIHPGVQNTDMRVSEILTFSENYHVVFQGKIDFSLNIADQIASLIS